MLRPYGIPCIALARRAPPRIVAFRGSIWPVRKTGGGVTAYRFPDSNVFYRKLGRSYPRIVRGEGCWLYDEQGKDYLDAVGGAYVANLGHSNPDVADALARQAREFGYLSATAFTHGPVEELARELAATLPGDLDKLYFLSSGSEAVEAALKLARQYWVEAGKPGKHRIIALAPPGVLPHDPGDLRPPSGAVRGRRDPVRSRSHGHLVGGRSIRCDAGHHDAGEGDLRRLRPAVGRRRARADRRRHRAGLGELPACPDLLISPRGVRGGTRRRPSAQARSSGGALCQAWAGAARTARGADAATPRGGRPGAGPARRHRGRGGQDQPGPRPTRGQGRPGGYRGRAGGRSRRLAQRGARRRRQRRPGCRGATFHYLGAGDRPDRDALHHGAHD